MCAPAHACVCMCVYVCACVCGGRGRGVPNVTLRVPGLRRVESKHRPKSLAALRARGACWHHCLCNNAHTQRCTCLRAESLGHGRHNRQKGWEGTPRCWPPSRHHPRPPLLPRTILRRIRNRSSKRKVAQMEARGTSHGTTAGILPNFRSKVAIPADHAPSTSNNRLPIHYSQKVSESGKLE